MHHLTFIHYLHSLLSQHDIDPVEWTIRALDTVESTNDEVKHLFLHYDKIVILAKKQSQGRGRNGRQWYSPEGGIWMSIGMKGEFPAKELSTPVIEAVQQVLHERVSCVIKPPNDILIGDKKLCGVLVETEGSGENFVQVVTGIGINVENEIPEQVSSIATRLIDHSDERPVLYSLAAEVALAVIKKLNSEYR